MNNVSTFDEYASMVFVPHITKHLQQSTRVDLVWDTYIDNSIKASTRQKRGKGLRRKVARKNKLPGLFKFLSQKIVSAN